MKTLSKFWAGGKKVCCWIKANSGILLLSGSLLSVTLIVFFCQRRTLRALRIELAILKTKLKLEKLAVEKDIAVQNIAALKEKDKEIRDRLLKFEADLKNELPDDMSEEEIVNSFKVLGLLKKD